MVIGGFVKQSLIDYPGKIASVIFTSGCNFRCGYCHNPALVLPELIKKNRGIGEDEVLSFLSLRREWIDAAVVTGGEPTIHDDLPDFLGQIKNMGYLVKLDTNGSNPRMLGRLISHNLVDYVAMDIKAPLEGKTYGEIIGAHCFDKMGSILAESIELLKKAQIVVEFRTTVIPGIHDDSVVGKIKGYIGEGIVYTTNSFRGGGTISGLM